MGSLFARGCLATALLVALVGCRKSAPPDAAALRDEPTPKTSPEPAIATVPPVAFSSEPVSAFADAGASAGGTPFEQAQAYEANGQHWLARLVLENKALGPDGTKPELELLAAVCHGQGDSACVDACGRRLGRKLKFDEGRRPTAAGGWGPKFDGGAPSAALERGEHEEPDSDLARARDHVLAHRLREARAMLEPKVIDGKASKAELRLLRTVCKEQSDRMCVALCDAKLR